MGGTQPVDDVAAHGLAGFLKTGEHLIGQRETAEHILGHDGAAGEHAVAVEPGLAVGDGPGGGIGRGWYRERPPAHDIGRGPRARGILRLGEGGTTHAQAGASGPPLRAMRGAARAGTAGRQSGANRRERIGTHQAHLY